MIPNDGLLVLGSNVLFYGGITDTALVSSNRVELKVDRFKLMDYHGSSVTNELATYDIFIQKGLYREGQLKYLTTVNLKNQTEATIEIGPDQLTSAGWYTIIVRNQDRVREYTTFFVSGLE